MTEMLKEKKVKGSEVEAESDAVLSVCDEAETMKFIDRLALQRKLLINFIGPSQTSDNEIENEAHADHSQ
ncbi:MAG: hypothetical protein CVU14_09975 [Bacteroidetes bacterium HGW-Bacteroidetes-9]|jgi:flagellar biosynthesis regulator FlaF|nr:MAG: hypothetical protein CVU14_09975 [Bacteroidetes bacterium HGW-Bacteroidetes-9]